MKKFITALLFLTMTLPLYAKLTQFILVGKITQQDYSKTEFQRENVDSVFVDIVKNGSDSVSFKVLNGNDSTKMVRDGSFRLIVQSGIGKYTLLLHRDGYEPLKSDFEIRSEGQDVYNMRYLSMEKSHEKTLDEFVVVGTAIKMVMKGDTIVYDSAAFKLPEGSMLEALVRQLPGAEFDDDGSIIVNGRKVSSLLLNGEDYFNGDPDVMLKNLPAYVVSKVKVYDRSTNDDNVTMASHRLSDSTFEENLVMDVTVKKEFSMATIFNVEGGYGPGIYTGKDPKKFDHRYIGRTFLVGFGKNYRFSAYGNANNIKNNSKASSSSKKWGNGTTQNGEMDVAMGGMDIFYKPNEKIKLIGNLQYTHEDVNLQQLTSKTYFYDTGNLYSRSRQEQNSINNKLNANLGLEYTGKDIYVEIYPSIRWTKTSSTEFLYNINLDRNPNEASRGAAIDSLFALKPGETATPSFLNSVTSYDYQSVRGGNPSDVLTYWTYIYATWRPRKGRGTMTLGADITDNRNTTQQGHIYYQTLTDASIEPTRKQQWTDEESEKTELNAYLRYNWEKYIMRSDAVGHKLSFSVRALWTMERNSNKNKLEYEVLMQGLGSTNELLPSLTAPENVTPLIDANNTLRSLSLNNAAGGKIEVNYKKELLNPGDSAMNLIPGVFLNYSVQEQFRHLSYSKPYTDPNFNYRTKSVDPTHQLNIGATLGSDNKQRSNSFTLTYQFLTGLTNLMALVPSTNSSDPFNVYLGPDGGKFKNPFIQAVTAYYYHYNKISHFSLNAYATSNMSYNALAQTAVFDQASGITYHRPVSVNGNRYFIGELGANAPFGHKERWSVLGTITYRHNNSVDYTSSVGEAMRSVVRSNNLSGNVTFSYKIDNGTCFSLGGKTLWQHAASPRADFSKISAFNSDVHAEIFFYLPWGIEGYTSLTTNFRRGYEDSALNSTEWIWNASVQKSLLKGALTFKINAVDLLGQLSTVTYRVNAQGRTEIWTNNLPRYAMLTVAYQFNFTPNALK